MAGAGATFVSLEGSLSMETTNTGIPGEEQTVWVPDVAEPPVCF